MQTHHLCIQQTGHLLMQALGALFDRTPDTRELKYMNGQWMLYNKTRCSCILAAVNLYTSLS